MKILGIDIGTTTISAVVMENEQVLMDITEKNETFLEPAFVGEKIQDVNQILERALSIVEKMMKAYPNIERIGVTGQMHGILYLDENGEAISPLYTWQDTRGDLTCTKEATDETWVEYLKRKTGHSVASGYGLVTHVYNLEENQSNEMQDIISRAVTCCTIGDYIAMKLCGLKTPVMDKSNAASIGFFDVERGCFDNSALEQIGVSPDFLPKIAMNPVLGRYQGKVDVVIAIGDNQASFLGAMKGNYDKVLVNVGTGSQVSIFTEHFMMVEGLETRPMAGDGYLLAGASLCGGRAYALLENFFRQIGAMLGVEQDNCYENMTKLLDEHGRPDNIPKTVPLFQGTRQASSLTGSITGITVENLTPLHLIWSMMEGMAEELNQMYRQYLQAGGQQKMLLGSGNGLQKNKYLQCCFEKVFGCKLELSDCREEAAVGAAIFAMRGF